ncbi:MAG: hypothetical protein GY836_10805, partial [Herbaspirillum sp.]|uniref:hypothetical protein n=1 Tax=Herbaspirillum sp. TaxID=1890675 RepID=UPI0025883D24
MGTCYRVYIFDSYFNEFEWFNRNKFITQIHEILPDSEIEAVLDNMLIFDFGKSHPSEILHIIPGKPPLGVIQYNQDSDDGMIFHDLDNENINVIDHDKAKIYSKKTINLAETTGNSACDLAAMLKSLSKDGCSIED